MDLVAHQSLSRDLQDPKAARALSLQGSKEGNRGELSINYL